MTEFVNDNGDRLEYSGEDVTLTKQIASFRSFKIKGDFTASFKIDNNSQNRQALGYYGLQQIGNHGFAPNPFSMIRNGNLNSSGNIIIEDDDGQDIGCYFVSGNANWFKAFDFYCNKITNTSLQVQWNITEIVASVGRTYGIIFPLIDWIFGRQKFDKYFMSGGLRGVGDPANGADITEFYPCLYVHTMVRELARVAKIKIDGSLLNDQLYKTIIITPAGPDLVDGTTGTVLSTAGSTQTVGGPWIQISYIAPSDIKAIDFIKWLCFSFGCVPTFDESSQTLSLNIIDKFKKEDAQDWSQYFQGHQVKYSDFSEHNNIKIKQALEDEISITYNKANLIPYAETDIRSKKLDGSSIDLYTSPFAPVKDDVGTTKLKWAAPFVQFAKLKDDKSFAYTSVTNSGGKAQFDGVFTNSQDNGTVNSIFRVVDDAGIYDGYHVVSNINNRGATQVSSMADYISNSTGTIYDQKITKQSGGNRILVCIPSIPVNNLTALTGLRFFFYSASDITSVATAYYSKSLTPYGNLNNYRKGLTYGELNYSTYNDITLVESYWNKIRAFILNPPLFGYFLLPENIFAAFKFDKFIFIRHKELTGYFLVESIENYKDDSTIVRCVLNYLDGYSVLTGYSLQGIKAGYPEIDSTGHATGYDPAVDYDKFDTQI